jgi:FkbM family methyltransferase
MHNTQVLKIPTGQKLFNAGIKIYEQVRLTARVARREIKDVYLVNFIEQSIIEGETVLDIGSKDAEILSLMHKNVGATGRIIAFQSEPGLYLRLGHLKSLLRWKNIELEFIRLSNSLKTKEHVITSAEQHVYDNAMVINLEENIKTFGSYKIAFATMDNYCGMWGVKPGFIKIDANGNELKLLKGLINTLQTFKPRIFLKCEEKIAGKQAILDTFLFLKQMNYKGHFFLDAMRIPIRNFDFDTYQNACKDFYCKYFIFE